MNYAEALRLFKADYLRELLRRHEGNVTQAAREAGMSRPNLYRLLCRLKVNNPCRSPCGGTWHFHGI